MTQPLSQAEYLTRSFLMHRQALQDLLGQVPEEQGSFSAWDGGMNFIQQADHLSASGARIFSMLRGEQPADMTPSSSLSDARARLWDNTELVTQGVGSLSDADLARTVPAFGGRQMPVHALVDFIVQHEAHHKGQVWMMARMIGIKPGMFVRL